MKPEIIRYGKRGFRLVAVAACCLFFVTGCVRFNKQKPGEKPDLSGPRQSFYSAPIDRLGSGVANAFSGPFELIYQMKEEIKRTSPVRGLIPGLLKGVTWLGLREAVGVFEIGTFFLPLKPHLKPMNTDWLSA